MLMRCAVLVWSLGALAAFAAADGKPGFCSMFGSCGQQFSCANYTAAVTPQFDLGSLCPDLAGQNACCDDTQYMSLKVGLSQLSALFGRCPACQRNLATLLCAAVCSPNQSQFVSVVATVPGASNQSLVTLASLSLSVDFAQGLYASCSNVQFASSNTTVFQLVFGATDQLSFFYRFGASMQPPLSFALGAPGSPFAFSSAIAACNDSSAALHCRCQDCPAACGSVQCDPYWECPTGSTCCPNNSGGFNCCPYVDATCCSDNVHCCPPDYPICNLSAGQCQSSVGARELAPRWPAQRRLT